MVKKIRVGLGKQFSRRTMYPSEAGYIQNVNMQMREITKQVEQVISELEDISEDVIMEALQPTFEKAKYYTPKDTMELVESAYLEKTGFRGKPRVEKGFAKGGSPHYAVYVHEILEYQHAEPTKAKFLEHAMNEDLQMIYKRLGQLYWESLFA